MSRRPFVLLTALLLLLAGCVPTPPTPTPSPTPTASATATPSATPSPTATPGPARVFVYFVVDATRGPRLAREQRLVDPSTPAKGALEAMIAGPTDPDYLSAWPRGTRILGISHRDHVITVDLSGEARAANVGAAFEGAMVDQLIWTVTGVLEPTASVMVNIEGHPAGDTWGHMVWDKPVPRGDPLDKRLLVGIDSLAENDTVTSPVRVTGEANVFEANLQWDVLRMDGHTMASGHTMTAEGQTFAPWELVLTLPAGTYMLEVFEDDPSGGDSQRPPDRDSRMFTVT